MPQPGNAAAEQVVRAQSILSDLITQQSEIQAAIARQQATIEGLMMSAVWETPVEEPPVEEPEESEEPEEYPPVEPTEDPEVEE